MDNELYHLIFIDDDKDFLHSMNMAVSSHLVTNNDELDIEPHFVSNPQEGLSFMQELKEEEEKIAVIVSDQQMPDMTGIEFIEKACEIEPKAIRILLTGHASLDSAKYAINNQILDQYVSKPIEDYDNFSSIIKNAISRYRLTEEKEQAEEKIRQYIIELEHTNRRIKNMHLAAEKIAYLAQGFRKLDLDEVLELIISRLPGIFGAKYSSLFLLNEDGNSLQMVKSNYLSENYIKPLNIDDQSPMMVALRQNKIIVLRDIEEASYDFLHKEFLGTSCIIIPFIIGGEQNSCDLLGCGDGIKGVLNMGNIADTDNEDILHYAASLIRNIMGINILNARLYQKTQKLALIDGLTGLYNKHIFLEFLSKECEYSERHGRPFYLSMIDADDFKAINDTHGHLTGDEVLNQLGFILNSASRKADIVARFGGEEFAWLIHRGSLENIIGVLERLRTEVASSEFSDSIRMTISIGVTRFYPRSNDNLEKLIERADKALYQAKNNGKNRIEVLMRDEHVQQLQK